MHLSEGCSVSAQSTLYVTRSNIVREHDVAGVPTHTTSAGPDDKRAEMQCNRSTGVIYTISLKTALGDLVRVAHRVLIPT